jgi:tetratricopeptide (TPR) repeat protein
VTTPPLRPEFEGLTFGNPSAVLTVVAMLAVPTAASARTSERLQWIVAVAVGATVALVALLSGSRAGWLAMALAGVAIAGLWMTSPGRRETLRSIGSRLASSRRGRLSIALALGAILSVAILVGPALVRRASEGGEAARATYWVVAARLFVQSPIVGTGPGTWVIERISQTQSGEIDYYIPHAHNVPVQTLAELGALGGAAGVLLVISLVRLISGAIRGDNRADRVWGWVTGLGLLYFGLHQLLDFYPNMPAVLFVAALPVAYLDATAVSRGQRAFPRAPGKRWLLGALVPLVAAAAFVMWQEVPALESASAVESANAGDWSVADGAAQAAARLDPQISSYQLTAGLLAARRGDHAGAAAAFERVTRQDDLPEAWLDLAAEQAALGDPTAATASLRAALRLGRQRPAIAMPAGDLAMKLGDNTLALSAFTAAIERVPSIAADPWWQGDPVRKELLIRALDTTLTSSDARARWQIALMAGDAPRSTALSASADDPGLARLVIDAWTGDEAARTQILQDCSANPLDTTRLGWCARIEAHSGEAGRAEEYRFLANSIAINGLSTAAETRVYNGDVIGRAIAGNPATYWGLFTYRRATPYDMLVGSLVHLVWE